MLSEGDFPNLGNVTIEVRLLGLLALVGKQTKIRHAIPAGTLLSAFMSQLSERLGPDFRNFVMDKNGHIYPGIMFVQDKKIISPRILPTFRLEKECVLSIMPIVSGG